MLFRSKLCVNESVVEVVIAFASKSKGDLLPEDKLTLNQRGLNPAVYRGVSTKKTSYQSRFLLKHISLLSPTMNGLNFKPEPILCDGENCFVFEV